MSALSFIHRFEPGGRNDLPPLLVLHGTGGNEHDLLPLGKMIAPGAGLLSPRGKVSENGMPRFFRRLAEGVFDEEDLRLRANELADFVTAARREYGIAAPVALGYSNGANIAAAMMLLRPQALAGGILLRAMRPLADAGAPGSLTGRSMLIVSGARDPLMAPDNAAGLATALRDAGATVQHQTIGAGHELSQQDVTLARQWLQGVRGDLSAAS